MEKSGVVFMENIKKTFDDELILDSISFAVKDGEFMTLLGPSGCGKTTTLRIIGGFETPDSGNIYFDGKKINDLPPYKRNVNTVFQKYALFPHLDVYDNIAFGLKIKKMSVREIDIKVAEMLELVNLKGYESRAITQLSGGQQQRVAIARALVNKPRVLLLDEPLGALDLKLRKEMQFELKNIQQQLGITFIYVTHDQEEALTMSDTIVVMDKGEILQNDTPVNIYNEPVNAFVADFIGESNILDGVMPKDYRVEFAGRVFECVDKGFGRNEPVDVVIRPEDIRFSSEENALITGMVENVIFKGVHYEILVSSNQDEDGIDYEWMIHSTTFEPAGKRIGMHLMPIDIHVMKKSRYSKKGALADDEKR